MQKKGVGTLPTCEVSDTLSALTDLTKKRCHPGHVAAKRSLNIVLPAVGMFPYYSRKEFVIVVTV